MHYDDNDVPRVLKPLSLIEDDVAVESARSTKASKSQKIGADGMTKATSSMTKDAGTQANNKSSSTATKETPGATTMSQTVGEPAES